QVYSGGHLTSRELVDAEAAHRMARVELEAAEENVRLLGGTPGEGSSVALTSPISGTVEDCSITLGETVDSEHVAFTVINLEQVWARLAVAPRDQGKVQVGDPVELTAESAPGRVFRGRVRGIRPGTDEATRALYLRAVLDNPDARLKSGTFVRGHVVTDVRQRRLTVPEGALQEHTGRPTLYVATGGPGSFEVRHVVLGEQGDGWREVADGLKPGERLAVSGTFYLKSEALKSSLSDGCCGIAK
ncbi:MAG: efflux RND transporter periplasmic adaptor subunit, partial [Candidatus Eremiobacterota bacterium]